jgi:hypothetical protein
VRFDGTTHLPAERGRQGKGEYLAMRSFIVLALLAGIVLTFSVRERLIPGFSFSSVPPFTGEQPAMSI